MPVERRGRRWRTPARVGGQVLGLLLAGGSTAWLLGRTAQSVAGDKHAPWIVGRASGITAYLLLACVVAAGLLLAHPWRSRIRRPSTVTRIRLHLVLAVFALAFTVLHVVVLATDRYAGVGWRGALLPLGASYRPVPVTLGVIGAYAGLLAGITAAVAGRVTRHLWWPLHRVSAGAFVLVWAHGLLSGSDSHVLLGLYAGSGAALVALALSRYLATTPADRLSALAAATRQVRTAAVPGYRPLPPHLSPSLPPHLPPHLSPRLVTGSQPADRSRPGGEPEPGAGALSGARGQAPAAPTSALRVLR